ncbi:MAG: TolC family outer membrane protein [Betaproteobacteria bacterium]|nr:TolC family outer membrane protein [Betaproteobacteria bacterium]
MTLPRLKVSALALAGLLAVEPLFAADLLSVYKDALSNDPAYAAARAEFRATQERTPQARAGYLPSATLTGRADRTRSEFETGPSSNTDTSSYTLSLSQPLYRPQSWIAIDQANLQVVSADAKVRDALQDLIVRTAQAYFDVLLAQDNVMLSEAQKRAIGEQLAQAKRNFEVGTATIVDTYEAQAKYDLAVAKEIADRNDLDIKQRALQQLIGKVAPGLSPLKDQVSLPLPTPADMEQWVAAAEKDSLTIAQLRASFEIANKEIARTRAGHLPTLDLTGSYFNAPNTASSLSIKEQTAVGLVLTIPLYSGGATQSRVREALSNKDRAEQDLERTRRSVAQQVRQSFLGVTNGAAQVKAFEAALVSNQSSLDSTILGREVGVRTGVDVLNAQQQLFQARRDLQQARYATILSQLRLKSAAGRLAEEDLAEVNRLLTK